MFLLDLDGLVVGDTWTLSSIGAKDIVRLQAHDGLLQVGMIAGKTAVGFAGERQDSGHIGGSQRLVESFYAGLLDIREVFVGDVQVIEEEDNEALGCGRGVRSGVCGRRWVRLCVSG